MASLTNPLIFQFLFVGVLSISLTTTHATVSNDDLITTMCKTTPDPPTCEAILRANPQSPSADARTLLLIMIDGVKSKFLGAINETEQKIKETKEANMIKAMKKCVRLYNIVVPEYYDMAVYAVKSGNKKFAEEAMNNSGIEAEACKYAFPKDKIPDPFVKQTQMLRGVCDIASSLVKNTM